MNDYSVIALAIYDTISFVVTDDHSTLVAKLKEFGAVGVSCDFKTYGKKYPKLAAGSLSLPPSPHHECLRALVLCLVSIATIYTPNTIAVQEQKVDRRCKNRIWAPHTHALNEVFRTRSCLR